MFKRNIIMIKLMIDAIQYADFSKVLNTVTTSNAKVDIS
jgi:hypothetical protein